MPAFLHIVIALLLLLATGPLPFAGADGDEIVAFQFDDDDLDGQTPVEEIEHFDWGPLTLRSHAAIVNTRLSYTPGRIGALREGDYEFVFAISHTNLWGEASGYFLDMEWTRYSLRFQAGLGDGWEVGTELGMLWRGGGIMDRFIEGFHSVLGITQARRDQHDRNTLLFITKDGRGEITRLDNGDSGFGIANPVISLKKEFFRQARGRPGFSFEVLLKLPLGDRRQEFATGGWDVAWDFGLQLPIVPELQFFGVFGLIISPGTEEVWGVETVTLQKFFLLGIEVREPGNDWTFVFHYLYQNGVAKNSVHFLLSKSTNEFLIGFKWAPGRTDDLVLEFGVIENSINDANTPDFGIHVAVRWHIR